PALTILTEAPEHALPFILGFAGYVLGWWLLFRRRGWGSALSTLEHELTHALFALLTFHRVKSIKTTWRQGGAMQFEGGGNWLILIAPYFVPTLSLAVLAVMFILDDGGARWLHIGLGATVSYHATSTWRETHREQTDLQEVGFLFAFLFLPAANVLCYGLILAIVAEGWAAGNAYLSATSSSALALAGRLYAHLPF
ncbi:MAG: M50 family metallopeptidase, partial [Planctomycetota bacterium]|nr:M50 family metallopeptidase [Planctomycetota bacterium]